jgi:hypothetical protein
MGIPLKLGSVRDLLYHILRVASAAFVGDFEGGTTGQGSSPAGAFLPEALFS